MIQKILVKLKCTEAGRIKGHAGSELHAYFFKLVGDIDNDLANELHANELKPFVIGPLIGKIKRHEGISMVEYEEVYTFSIATLTRELTSLLSTITERLKKSDNPIKIGGATFSLEEIKVLFYKDMSYFRMLTKSEPKDRILFEFLSPTCFRRSGKLVLFPEPRLLFSSIVERWNQFSDTPLPVMDFDALQVSRYDLKTNMTQFSSYTLTGFRGKCEYSFGGEAEELNKWSINALSSFASIVGVGYKTTMGMGQVKVK